MTIAPVNSRINNGVGIARQSKKVMVIVVINNRTMAEATHIIARFTTTNITEVAVPLKTIGGQSNVRTACATNATVFRDTVVRHQARLANPVPITASTSNTQVQCAHHASPGKGHSAQAHSLVGY